MTAGSERVPGGSAASRFVRLFYSGPSAHLWEDAEGVEQTIHQGEGGEQGDPIVPLLFSMGQLDALSAIHEGMRVHERLFAFLVDIWLVSKPERVGDLHNSAERELWGRARIRIHSGKTHVWNRSGRKLPACDELQRRAEMLDEGARVWTRSEIPSIQQGIKVLRRFRAGAIGGHHSETQCIVTSNPERARHPVSIVVVAPLRFGTSKLPTQGAET